MRVDVVDPSAYTPPYDHSLCEALGQAGAQVRLVTSEFAYGAAPAPDHYVRAEFFYRRALGRPGSRLRLAAKLLEHGPDMARYRTAARSADVVHFQWLPVGWLDRHLLPARPLVLTAHDLLPREPRPGQVTAQRRLYERVDAVVAHSAFGAGQLVDELGVPEAKVHVIHHGAFEYLARLEPAELPAELVDDGGQAGPVVLFFGLVRPYKGVDVLLRAWSEVSAGSPDAQLWVVGHPRIPLGPLEAAAPPGVRFVPRFVSEAELAACFRRADLVVLPYRRTERLDFSGVLATALAFGKPTVVSDVGGFSEIAATGAAVLVAPDDAGGLSGAIGHLLDDEAERRRVADAARAAAAGPYSWQAAARLTMDLYRTISA
jgi:glycosyltransferase involved in cell wall biosynthesis